MNYEEYLEILSEDSTLRDSLHFEGHQVAIKEDKQISFTNPPKQRKMDILNNYLSNQLANHIMTMEMKGKLLVECSMLGFH